MSGRNTTKKLRCHTDVKARSVIAFGTGNNFSSKASVLEFLRAENKRAAKRVLDVLLPEEYHKEARRTKIPVAGNRT